MVAERCSTASPQFLGHAHHRQSQRVGLTEQPGRSGAGGVGVLGDEAQALEPEVAHRLTQHLLLVGGLEIEQVRLAHPGLARGARETLSGGERTACRGRRAAAI